MYCGQRWQKRSGLAALALLALLITDCQAYVLDEDVVQPRFDAATPPLNGSHTLVQSFVCQHPNLCEIELLPAVYEAYGEGTLTWRLTSTADGTELAAQSIPGAGIGANIPLRLTFSPRAESAGQAYALRLEGAAGVGVGFWRSSYNAYDGGDLQVDGTSVAGDLRFTTRCRSDPPILIQQAGLAFLPQLGLLIPLATLLLLPGYVFRHGLGLAQQSDPFATLALTIGFSLALVPVALLWSTAVGLRWQPALVCVAFALLAVCALVRLWRTRCTDLTPWLDRRHRWLILATAAILSVTVLLRLIQIRHLLLPAWVDSPQHALITRLLSLHGQVPGSYEPLLPVTTFYYHFGFQADAAAFAWLSGLPIPQAILILGQVLGAACALSAYPLSLRLTGRRMAAIVTVAIIGLVSYLPAYYVSWGRYTQLTGMVLLPAALVATLEWLEGTRREYRWLLGAAILQAGLFLTHARVSLFAVCFLLAYLLCAVAALLRTGGRHDTREIWLRSGFLAALALGLCAPWLLRLVAAFAATLRTAAGSLRGDPSYNAIPWDLLFIRWNRELMVIAALGAVVGLWRRRRETAWVLLWCLLVALAVNPGLLGLPGTNLLNNATAIIALFLPLAILGGQAVMFLWDCVPGALAHLARRRGRPGRLAAAARMLLALLLAGAVLWTAWGMVSIVNPDTVLATAEDLAAMAWIRDNTPPDALFLINTRHWQLGMYTGTDGGYWIPLLTDRRALLPVIAYTYGAPEYVQHVTEMASVVSRTKDVQTPEFQTILSQEEVTYIYIGAKGGPLAPGMFLGQPAYRTAYSSGGVWIFEVVR